MQPHFNFLEARREGGGGENGATRQAFTLVGLSDFRAAPMPPSLVGIERG